MPYIPYLPYIPSIPYIPNMPYQTDHTHHSGGRVTVLWLTHDHGGGEGGWNAGPYLYIYIYIHIQGIYTVRTHVQLHTYHLAPKQNHCLVLDCPSFVWASRAGGVFDTHVVKPIGNHTNIYPIMSLFSATLRQGVSHLWLSPKNREYNVVESIWNSIGYPILRRAPYMYIYIYR